MSERALPSGLSVADLLANPPCNWICFTKAKRGPDACHFCRFCSRFSRNRSCAMHQVAPPPPQP